MTPPNPQPVMTPQDALSILVQMADRAPGNGADHRMVGEAVGVLSAIIGPAEPQPQPESEPTPNRAQRRAAAKTKPTKAAAKTTKARARSAPAQLRSVTIPDDSATG